MKNQEIHSSRDGCPSDREINRREAGPERSGLAISVYSADNVPASNTAWVSDCWEAVRSLKRSNNWETAILVIDEIQKVSNWSEVVKKEWDDDSFNDRNIKVLLLGSSRVRLEKGLSESLAGRFEEIRMGHWRYVEMRDCFGWSLDQCIFMEGILVQHLWLVMKTVSSSIFNRP